MDAIQRLLNDLKSFFEIHVLNIIKEYFDLKAAIDILLLAFEVLASS